MLSPGTLLRASGTVRRCSRSISWAVMTVTELATFSTGVGVAVGLTTTVLSPAPVNAVPGRGVPDLLGLGLGRGAVTLTSGSSCSFTSGDAVCCAVAGWEQRANKTDVRAVEARTLALRPGTDLRENMCNPRDVVARHRE